MPQILRRTCPPAPAEACQVLDAVSVWWQIQLDPQNTSRDEQFQSRVDASIAATEAWVKREPRRAEAWFYVGGAYGARAQWRVLRVERLGAARDGKQIKESLEKALVLDPRLQEAYFGIGLYHYYADVAPAAAKVLRWLLWLPGGNKVQGMQEMLRARDNGALMRDEADYQLHIIDLWYEKQPQLALELLQQLRDRHPRNPLFPQLIADVQDERYLHDLTASLRSVTGAARCRKGRPRRLSGAGGHHAPGLAPATQLRSPLRNRRWRSTLSSARSSPPTRPRRFGAVAAGAARAALPGTALAPHRHARPGVPSLDRRVASARTR